MSSLIVVITIAIIAGVVYGLYKTGFKSGLIQSDFEHEKATNQETRKVAEGLNTALLEIDAQERAKEREEEREAYEIENPVTRTRIGFYPRLHPDTDKDNLN